MKNFTQKMIDLLALPSEKQVLLRDKQLQGFGIRLTAGASSYIVEARVNGKKKRITVGRTDLLTLEQARKKAIHMLAQMTSGIDPQLEKRKQEASAITLDVVLDQYVRP